MAMFNFSNKNIPITPQTKKNLWTRKSYSNAQNLKNVKLN